MAFRVIRRATVPNPSGVVTSITNAGPGILKGTWDAKGGRSYTSKLTVETSSKYVGTIQVIQAMGFRYGDYYRWPLPEYNGVDVMPLLPVEQDTGSFLQSIAVEQNSEDGRQWMITLEYTPFDINAELGEQDVDGLIDPTTRPAEVSWGSAKYERSRPFDESQPSQAFLNTAGDPFEDPPKTEESRPILTITRNEWNYDVTWTRNFINHVNNDIFLGYPPNVVKCKDINAKQVFDQDWGYYWDVTYEFEFRDDEEGNGWDELVLNAGYRKLDVDGNRVPIIVGGFPISSPQALSRGGDVLASGTDPTYIIFKLFRPADFNNLNLPDDLLTRTGLPV